VPSSSTTHHHVTPVTPAAPSETIIVLQRELGQLNYYEGPVTGVMNEQTVQAITYLQRDAHLPQTGTMNAGHPGRAPAHARHRQQPDGRQQLIHPPPAAGRARHGPGRSGVDGERQPAERHCVGLTPCTCPNTRAK
jgi:peptidoglycan hydrolase-like protein with peptidoglycan-binding domain